MKICDNRILLNHIRVPLRRFSLLWDNKISTENRDRTSPPPLLSNKVSTLEVFWTQNISPTKFFGTLTQQIFDGKPWYSPQRTSHETFRFRNFSEAEKGSVTIFSVLWDNKFSTASRDTLPVLFSLTFFGTRIFLKHSMKRLRNVSVL